MAETKNRLVLNEDGTWVHEQIYTQTKMVNEELMRVLSQSVPSVFKNMMEIDGQSISYGKISGEEILVMRLKTLRMCCHFELNEGVLTPVFTDKSKAGDLPMFNAVWVVPASMKLVFATRIYRLGDAFETRVADGCALVAIDKDGRTYQMPLSNLYDTCYLCTGQFVGQSKTMLGSFKLAYEQFCKSDWNSHLTDSFKLQGSKKLFMFKPTATDIECIPFSGDWTALCQKRSTSFLTNIVQVA